MQAIFPDGDFPGSAGLWWQPSAPLDRAGGLAAKLQITSTKTCRRQAQTRTKLKIPNSKRASLLRLSSLSRRSCLAARAFGAGRFGDWNLSFGTCLLFGACNLALRAAQCRHQGPAAPDFPRPPPRPTASAGRCCYSPWPLRKAADACQGIQAASGRFGRPCPRPRRPNAAGPRWPRPRGWPAA